MYLYKEVFRPTRWTDVFYNKNCIFYTTNNTMLMKIWRKNLFRIFQVNVNPNKIIMKTNPSKVQLYIMYLSKHLKNNSRINRIFSPLYSFFIHGKNVWKNRTFERTMKSIHDWQFSCFAKTCYEPAALISNFQRKLNFFIVIQF